MMQTATGRSSRHRIPAAQGVAKFTDVPDAAGSGRAQLALKKHAWSPFVVGFDDTPFLDPNPGKRDIAIVTP